MFFDRIHEPAEVLDLDEGKLLLCRAGNGDKVAVAKIGGEYHAVSDRCAHLGCSLAKARLEGTSLTCHCHGSQFDVRTGDVLRGPASHGVRSYAVQVKGDRVTIEPVVESQAV